MSMVKSRSNGGFHTLVGWGVSHGIKSGSGRYD